MKPSFQLIRSLIVFVVVLGGEHQLRAQESTFQVITLNRLIQFIAYKMLPLEFDVVDPSTHQPLTIQISDSWYCDGSVGNEASMVVVILPKGVSLPSRPGANKAACDTHDLSSVFATFESTSPRPADWMAAAFISVSPKTGGLELSFVQTKFSTRPGVVIPPAVVSQLAQTAVAFKTIDTTGVAITVQGKTEKFNLAFLFSPASLTVFAYPQDVSVPSSLTVPSDVSLSDLPIGTNAIFRISHASAKQQLTGPLAGMNFPLVVGGLTYTVSNLNIAGDVNTYQTSGTVSSGGNQLHLAINWTGKDLGFQNVRLAEAAASCAPVDIGCRARKAAAAALQTVLSGVAPQGKPLRPTTARDTEVFHVSNKDIALHMTVLRSTSTAVSLQLPSFLSIGGK